MVHFKNLMITAICAFSTATQGSVAESPALANPATEGSTPPPHATIKKAKVENKEKNGDRHDDKENGKKQDHKVNDRVDHHDEKHDNQDNKGNGDHKENHGNHDDKENKGHGDHKESHGGRIHKDNKGHGDHKESHGGRGNKDNKGHDNHKGSQRDHDHKKHMGHHGKPERFRWVDGDFGDFYRCPSPKAHCHNGNRRYHWEDHSKRCWIKYESGDECCYSFTQDGCHMFRKETIYTC